jgi:glycine/serine hydroxymethyltransferase
VGGNELRRSLLYSPHDHDASRKMNTGVRDDKLFALVDREFRRQRDGLELIASEKLHL